MSNKRADPIGLAGYSCLGSLLCGGLVSGCGLLLLGIREYLLARDPLESAREAQALLSSLEGAVLSVALGALLLLIAFVSGVVLLKELSDEAKQRERGSI